MLVSEIKPVKYEKLIEEIRSTYNIADKDLTYLNLKQPKSAQLKKLFLKVLTSETLNKVEIFPCPITGNVNNYHEGLIKMMVCHVFQYFRFQDADECLPIQMFTFPDMQMLRRVLTALLKVGKFLNENHAKVLEAANQIRVATTNQEILYWGRDFFLSE